MYVDERVHTHTHTQTDEDTGMRHFHANMLRERRTDGRRKGVRACVRASEGEE